MELSGKVIAVLPVVTGTGKNGKEWKKADFVIEVPGEYPKKVCFTMFGEKVKYMPKVGEQVSVQFEISSMESKGKWFTSINAWKVEKGGQRQAQNRNYDDEVAF